MADASFTDAVRKFYNTLNDEGSFTFTCRLNEEKLTERQQEVFRLLNEETRKRYYGTGLAIPENVKGKRVLDIGCGSGSLVFILSKLVGPTGYVVGIDVTEGLIQTAKNQTDYHCRLWGYDKPNFEFHVLNAEQLGEKFRADDFDVIVSNGVISLIPDKKRVFKAAYKLLKAGGQFLLNDTFAEKDPPEEKKGDVAFWVHYLTGALRWDTVGISTRSAGFSTPYLTWTAPVHVIGEERRQMLENRRYLCAGWRLFKLDCKAAKKGPSLVTYNGGISDYPDAFPWDVDTVFKKGVGVEVDGELATLLSSTYLSPFFSFQPASGQPSTPRNQNPFLLIDRLQAEGKLPKEIYQVL